MRNFANKFVVIFFLLLTISVLTFKVFAQEVTVTPTPSSSSGAVCSSVPECSEQKIDCSKCVEYLTNKKNEAAGKAKSLSTEISAMNSQISLTEARIKATEQLIKEIEKDIEIAQGKISELETDIDRASRLLIERIAAVYQVGNMEPWQIFLTSSTIEDVFNRLKYLRLVQIADKKKVYAAEQAKTDYNNQKQIFEDKEQEAQTQSKKLEDYNKQLEDEKSGKQQLLQVTKNDEARYQRLVSEARAERAIVLGGGKEVYLREVNEGDTIGSIISGSSGCSSGTHLHLSIYQGTSMRDPSEFISPKSFSYSYPESQFGYYGSINPRGSYPWPINDQITINQGFGSHGFARQFYPSGIHDGIDMAGGNLAVKAIRPGKLYEGSYSCSNGPLTYAKVVHDDGLISWYLHIYPN